MSGVGTGSKLHERPLKTVSNEKESHSQDVIQQPVSPIAVTVESNFPSLEYDIASKKQSIAISAFIILLVNAFTPAVVYYILQYGQSKIKSL